MADPQAAASLIAAIRAGAEALDRGERGPAREIALLHDAGLLVAPLPPELGGCGWGTRAEGAEAICDLLMALGGAALPIARLFEGHVNAVRLVDRFGSPEQRGAMAHLVVGGGLLGVWGADAGAAVAIAKDCGSPVLTGTKAFASGLGDVALAIVTAASADGSRMVLVTADDPARASPGRWDVDGMVGSCSGWFDCAGLPAGPAQLLGPPGALLEEPDFHGGVWRLVASYAGAMRRLTELAAQAIDARGQVDAALAQLRLGQVVMEAETAVLWSRAAAHRTECGGETEDTVATALLAREATEQAANRMLALIERIVGTAMHARRSEIGRTARDLRFFLRQAYLDEKLALATRLRVPDLLP